jgi:hypothetical protein
VLTLGVDLASQDANTAICRVRWEDGRRYVDEVDVGVGDPRILELSRTVDAPGIDAPFGWPALRRRPRPVDGWVAVARRVGQGDAVAGAWTQRDTSATPPSGSGCLLPSARSVPASAELGEAGERDEHHQHRDHVARRQERRLGLPAGRDH